MWFYYTVMYQKDVDGMENSVDPDQTAPSEIRVCIGLSVQTLRIIKAVYGKLWFRQSL